METRCVLVCFLMVIAHLEVQGQTTYNNINLTGHACGMSSQYYAADAKNYSDCHGAINGNTSRYFLITPTLQNCIHTSGSNDPTPVWWVDMGQNYTVYFIRIFARYGETHRLKYLTVAIDQHAVYNTGDTIPTVDNTGLYFDIQAPNLPYTGRNLTISRNDQTVVDSNKVLNFCEVQVWGCSPGYYGSTCTQCGEGCENGVCQQDGTCSCKPGWTTQYCNTPCHHGYYGQTCRFECSAGCNQNRKCNTIDGTCTCQPGWRGNKCSECADGYYGATCESCGHCAGGAPCNKQNGNCQSCVDQRWSMPLCNSCSPGYYGSTCTQCGEGCQNGECRQDGTCSCKPGWTPQYCSTPCQHGYYGQDCKLQCSAGCDQNGKCGNVNGTCVCQPGWRGDKCKECAAGHYGASCEACGAGCQSGTCQEDGQCVCTPGWLPGKCTTPCPQGRYGQNCTSKCGTGCVGTKCDAASGACNCSSNRWIAPVCTECAAGHYGAYCEACGDGCQSGACQEDGQCVCAPGWLPGNCTMPCPQGRYGQNCTSKCGTGCDGNKCDAASGACNCSSNRWIGPVCTVCNVTFWGTENCSLPCGNCGGDGSCKMANGQCLLGCDDGWAGAACTQKLGSSDIGSVNVSGVVGGALAAVVAIAIGVVAGVILFRRRRQTKRREDTDVRSGSHYKTGNDDRSDDIPITSSIPSEATVTVSKKDKPKLPVKPMRRDVTGHEETIPVPLYGNVSQASFTSEPARSNTRPPVLASKPRATRSAGNVYENMSLPPQNLPSAESAVITKHDKAVSRRTVTSAGDADDLSEVLVEEEDDVYNTEDLYIVYKNTRPQVDALQQYLIDALASGELSGQFKNFARGMQLPHKDGMTDENVIKNRFKAMCAYDFNRVHLHRQNGDPESDYINASYVKGCRGDKQYIATQGPRDNTVDDLWLMVWQEKVTQMVMLTNIQEDGKDKCKEYWPASGKTQMYGHVTVRALELQERSDYIIRPFLLRGERTSTERQVIQYHYNTWPDHGVPQAAALVDFWRYVKGRGDPTVPLLVHCSAGVGRTGTFIALDIASEREALGREVNVKDIVTELREQRCIMVQSEAQYKFLHQVILEAHTSRDTRIRADKFEEVFLDTISVDKPDKRIDGEFKMLQAMGKHAPKPTHTMAEMEENRNKNRNQDALPDDKHLAYLTVHVRGRNQYINAVYMSSFLHHRGLLLTQLPIPNTTMVDFWRMVDGCDVKTVVSLGSELEHDTVKGFCQYWPLTVSEVLDAGPYEITMASLNKMSGHLISYGLTVLNKTENKRRPMQLFHYQAWAGEVPDDTASLLQLVDTIKASAEDDMTSPIVIQCIDGAARSGLFCAIYDIISRVTYDDEVDVYLTARHVQAVRPQAVATETQYRFLYQVAQEYIRHLNVYQNAGVA